MIISIFAYFLSFLIVSIIIKRKKVKFKPFPKLEINRNGIYFSSTSIHRIKVDNIKILQMGNTAYLKQNNTMVILNNVTNVRAIENFLYFKAMGKVKIIFNTTEIYRYFNIIIKSEKFNLTQLKQNALCDVLNNLFNVSLSKTLNKYINFVENVLNIKIDNEKIKVSKNKFNLNYELIYKINNRVKRIRVDETI